MRYLAVVQYKGTSFCGWQKQTVSKFPSIQEEIERVLSKILNSEIKIYGSGRTDAGVHAYGQTFHFDTEKEIDSYKFIHGFNELVNKDISLKNISLVSDDFHARFSAKSKTYLYKIRYGDDPNPFYKDFVLQLKQKLDIKMMEECSKIFLGEHNFQNFTSKEEDDANCVRNIFSIDFKEENNLLEIELNGNGFMRYMVRMLVGNLIQVGLGKISINEVKNSLESEIRKPSSYKASSEGLYLKSVEY